MILSRYTTARASQHTPHEGEHTYTKYAHQASASPSQHFAANVSSRQSGAPESASKPRILRIVSLPNRDHEARVARSAALEPRVMLIPPSATRPERAKLSQVLDGTVNTVERRRIPRIRPWTPPLSPRFSYMTEDTLQGTGREGLLAAIAHLLPHLKLAAVHDVAASGGLPRSFSRRPPRTAAA